MSCVLYPKSINSYNLATSSFNINILATCNINNLATMSADPYQNLDVNNDPYNIEIDEWSLYDGSQKAMLTIHPWILLASVIILLVSSVYAGFIHPILSKVFRLKYFNTGYAHNSRWTAILFSAFITCGVVTGIVLLWFFEGVKQNRSFVDTMWFYLDYWRSNNDERFIMPGYLFWYIYGSFFLNLVMCFFFYVFSRWNKTPTEIIQCSERHAFVIVAHNSSKKLTAPVAAILKFAQPHQIYIADNGSSVEEMEKTRVLCDSLSTAYSKIQVAHLKYGNKTLAQYSCVLELIKRYTNGVSDADIITLIDDDVFIPETFPSVSIETQLEDPTKIAIAYPLRVANADASLIATLQDGEYLTGNVSRFVQDLLGTQLFASGAIATWKLLPLKKVLERHNTAFNGEDLQMGYLTHKLCDTETAKLEAQGPVRIGFERNCSVPTTVPVHMWHWYDLLPNPLKRKWGIKACDCKEASFFTQRVR